MIRLFQPHAGDITRTRITYAVEKRNTRPGLPRMGVIRDIPFYLICELVTESVVIMLFVVSDNNFFVRHLGRLKNHYNGILGPFY